MKVKLKLRRAAGEPPEYSDEAMGESSPIGLPIIHGALGLLLLGLGAFFPVHWGLQHPAVVKQAAMRARENAVEFGQSMIHPTNAEENANPYAARLVWMAASQLKQKGADELGENLKPERDPAIRNFLHPNYRQTILQQLGNPSEEVTHILNVRKSKELQNHEPAILLTAWLHHNHMLGQMGDELVFLSRSKNLPGLKQFYLAMGTLADLMDEYQLMHLTKLMPDVETLARFSHIAMVQTMLPQFHSFGNNSDSNLASDSEQKDLVFKRAIVTDIDTDKDKEINMQEWVDYGHQPLEITDFPLTYTAVTWTGTPAGTKQVVDYLMKHGRAGDRDLHQAMKHGKGSFVHLVQSAERISPRGSSDTTLGAIAAFSLKHPKLARAIRLLLMILGGILTLRMFTMFSPITLANPRNVTLYRWRRRATAFVLLILMVIAGEPILFQSAASSEYDVAVRLPIANPENNPKVEPMLTAAADNSTDTISNIVMIALFLGIQIIVYITCLNKISEIRDGTDSPQQKLRLLENEDNLFDLGLYIGIGGTALGLGLIMLGVFTKPYAAYVSNIMGIACVAMVKIKHLRNTRQELLEEANKTDS
jgi:hypothetical protein